MAEKVSFPNFIFTFLGILGAILIFALLLFIAYLPNRPVPADQAVVEERQLKADEARAAGKAKLTGYEVINAEAGTVRIPIEEAIELTMKEYSATDADDAAE
ncbi:MAG: hypothetical protein AAGH40_06970 [Verrucomicrobiota bacterium]